MLHQCKVPDFDTCTIVMNENVLIVRKYTLKYVGVKGYDVCNLLSSG